MRTSETKQHQVQPNETNWTQMKSSELTRTLVKSVEIKWNETNWTHMKPNETQFTLLKPS